MSTGGLLFIPDISGFSQFVEKTEIEHSQFIIKHLLETLINCNQLDLQVSEIEGDAILFYKFGNPPGSKAIYDQVEKMFCDFHHLLRSLSVKRLCQCGACKESEKLSLKVITHQGEFTTYNIKEFSKLIGKDVIRAHQLLKNDIPEHEYWLVTDNLVHQNFKMDELPGWMHWVPGRKEIENDAINFQYVYLSPLLDKVPVESRFPSALQQNKTELVRVQKEGQADFMQLFYLTVNLDLRPQWVEGVRSIDKMGFPENLVGVSHRCILQNNSEVLITSHVRATDTCVEYEETTQNGQRTMHYEFNRMSANETNVAFAIYVKNNPLKQLLFNLFMKKRITRMLTTSMDNLVALSQKQQN